MDTTHEAPIACSLDATDLRERFSEMGDAGRSLRAVDARGNHAELRFARSAQTAARLAEIVAAESKCCAFLTFAVKESASEIVVAVSAPEGAETVLADIVMAFQGHVAA
jgi:hypothetical protein